MPTAVPLTTERGGNHGSTAINVQMGVKLLFLPAWLSFRC